MGNKFDYVEENLSRIRYNMAEAADKYRKPGETIRLMAVTKTVAPEVVNYAVSLGIDLLGENRVQEFLSKADSYVKCDKHGNPPEIHFIGHLQTNKVKYIIDSMSMIQSVDSVKLGTEINRLAARSNKVTDVLCEVNIGGEESKNGVKASEVYELVQRLSEMENIRVRGLMTIPPPWESEMNLAKMQELFMEIKMKNISGIVMDTLSMGMTHDYVEAVKYGSNLVRVGSGLFGERKYK